MNKVLYIDPVDKGYRNFLFFDNELKSRNIETLLVHTSSFFYPVDSKEKRIGNLLMRDISYYNTKLIGKVIRQENPDVIVVLNLSFIFDRAVVNFAKRHNIKIIYLSHGALVDASNYTQYKDQLDKSIKSNRKRIFSKKNFIYLLNYLHSQKGSKTISFLKLMNGIIKEPSRYLTFAKYDKELDVDRLLVYSKNDKKHLRDNMGFPDEKIKIIGTPEIAQFFHEKPIDKKDFLLSINQNPEINYAAYLDDGLAGGIWRTEDWYDHLDAINEILLKNKLHLIVKLHPRIDIKQHQGYTNKRNNIIFLQDVNFKNYILNSEFVINHYSSTAIYALLFHKKTLVPNWGLSEKLYKKYPPEVVYYCNSPAEFEEQIGDKIDQRHIDNIDNYLEEMEITKELNSIDLIVNEILS
ncbi:hypothetical protein LL912_01890 [Niabella sp. CC-SYL272]|uniref:hypothetical protein n=1 Tax=Niabella agricola TaxID=2891571 RepID=UPI001F379313|nr:hypothetical protein [Niabella agricola]MCF3107520.1 hypothetical protein [Niabella agricola]